jgi:hypothetical protein
MLLSHHSRSYRSPSRALCLKENLAGCGVLLVLVLEMTANCTEKVVLEFSQTHFEGTQAKLVVYPQGDIPALWLHNLTGTVHVKKLLDFGDRAIEEGHATLERLRTLDPKTAEQFAAKSSTATDIPFKLVSEINPCDGNDQEDSDHGARRSLDSFIAVSYCWRALQRLAAGGELSTSRTSRCVECTN